MGRFFSTVYRIILVGVGVSALVFSIMSATSCAFISFDHQYKGDGRYLLDSNINTAVDGNSGMERALQSTTIGGQDTTNPVGTSVASPIDTTATDAAAVDTTAADAAAVDTAAAEAPAVDTTAAEAAAAVATGSMSGGETPNMDTTVAEAAAAAELPAEDTATTATEATAAAAVDAPADDAAISPAEAIIAAAGESSTEATTVASDGTPADDTATPAEGTAAADDSSVAATTAGDEPTPDDATPVASPTAVDTTATQSQKPTEMPGGMELVAGPKEEEMGDDEDEEDNFPYGYPSNEADNESASASEATSTANGASEAVATASGDAGLYCNGERSFSITNLWGGSIKELEEDLADMSDSNVSEELARSAVVTASVFGLVAVFILIMESLIGWRVCCERWIVGLVAMCACISQGVTFLFFNSERYCDGDIVNEILNQEPCVIGQGGIYSIVAILLYALAMIMACRLPQDDPYGLCCKKRSAARNNENGGGNDNSSSRSKFGLLGGTPVGGKSGTSLVGGSDNDVDAASNGPERERPNWLSEEATRDKVEKEEQEII